MKVLITGANGLLGQKLSSLLDSKKGIDLITTARSPLAIQLKKGVFQLLDITNQEAVNRVISAVGPDVVINTAAMTQVDHCETEREKCWLSNVIAVEYLVKACERENAKLIHVSTDFIFDGTEGLLREDAKPHPVNYYGESKLAAERIIQESKIDWAILRTVLVYGITSDLSRSNIVLWV
ncbi:MAG TPA: sugar nucleotide-binding protein, partial [Cyclobacteriaceae bacterium]|nr:sugar nucleotide-binding protein [Cyclobacteriaceae bacterium]